MIKKFLSLNTLVLIAIWIGTHILGGMLSNGLLYRDVHRWDVAQQVWWFVPLFVWGPRVLFTVAYIVGWNK